jgi:hypothetical protein
MHTHARTGSGTSAFSDISPISAFKSRNNRPSAVLDKIFGSRRRSAEELDGWEWRCRGDDDFEDVPWPSAHHLWAEEDVRPSHLDLIYRTPTSSHSCKSKFEQPSPTPQRTSNTNSVQLASAGPSPLSNPPTTCTVPAEGRPLPRSSAHILNKAKSFHALRKQNNSRPSSKLPLPSADSSEDFFFPRRRRANLVAEERAALDAINLYLDHRKSPSSTCSLSVDVCRSPSSDRSVASSPFALDGLLEKALKLATPCRAWYRLHLSSSVSNDLVAASEKEAEVDIEIKNPGPTKADDFHNDMPLEDDNFVVTSADGQAL